MRTTSSHDDIGSCSGGAGTCNTPALLTRTFTGPTASSMAQAQSSRPFSSPTSPTHGLPLTSAATAFARASSPSRTTNVAPRSGKHTERGAADPARPAGHDGYAVNTLSAHALTFAI